MLQFRACGAEGGNQQSRPSHRTGGHPGAPRLRSLSSRTQDLTLKALEIPTSQRTGSHGCSGTGLDVPVFSGLTALPAPNSPRLHGRLWEPAFPIHSLPHVIRIPPGELANILIHIL